MIFNSYPVCTLVSPKNKMIKLLRTILSLLIVITNLDVRILHAQVTLPYSPVLPVTLVTPSITNLPLVTPSVFEKEKLIDLSNISFSFSKTDFGSLSRPSEKPDGLWSSSTTSRPSASGIIRANHLSSPSEYFLRQRFPSGTHLNHVRSDEHYNEALPVGRNLRLRPTWNYQEATGLLTSKVDDNAESVSYTYTTAGQLATRTWARGPVTTYGYDPNTAELLTVNYSDSTPDVTFTYDRLGRSKTVADGLGSRTFAYNAALQPLSETISGLYSATITRNYAASGVVGRPTGLTTGALYTQTYGYDTKGRYNFTGWTVNALSGSATYTYVANSDLLGTLTTGSGQSTTYTYETNRNLRTQIKNQFSSTTVSQYDYAYDAVGRRTSVKNSGTAFSAAAFNRFVYDNRNELGESARYLGTDVNVLTSPVTGEYRSFAYDPIGNRTNITVAANNGTYSANNLNQYSTENVAGGGTNTFTHDFDGNLTAISGNKNVQYVYNGENQLIAMQPTTPALNDKKVESVYDYQGRRVQKIISNWSGVAWVPLTTKRFVYDGWNVIEEQTVAGTSKYYVWGLDLSQSLQGAGGVGGLLTMFDGVGSYAYFYDGNGNVGQMVNNIGGAIAAHYEYDPYGNSILATGSQAAGNPYRFSTKYLDSEYNLYYYGYRYYDPATGRWLSRDPIGEQGGLNVYGFVNNNPTLYVDALGLFLESARNGTRAHTLFRDWGRNKYLDYDWEILLLNIIKPDVIDHIGERIWDLKPISHSIPTWKDKKQMSDYLCLTGYELGEPQDITNGRTYIGIIEDVWTGKPLDVYIFPGATGFILYDLVPKDDSEIPTIIPAKKEKKKEKKEDNSNYTPTTITNNNVNIIKVSPGLLNPILLPSYGN